MPTEILILGGYGNFGKRIARGLTQHGLPVIIAGRDLSQAQALCDDLPAGLARPLAMDIRHDFAAVLRAEKPSVVVHTCGPFQGSDYAIARACIAASVHYVDLADGRDFVRDFSRLDVEAKAANVTLIGGASTVPGLSSAVIEHFRPQFSMIDSADIGISPGQKSERGLATTRAIMSYIGKPLKPFAGHDQTYGWQDLHARTFPVMGRRWLAACDIPDLDLLPAYYGLKAIRFGAGLELGFMHFGVWAMSWLVRWGLPLDLTKLAEPLWKMATWFDPIGSDVGGMHVELKGQDHDGKSLTVTWFIVAENGDGPHIPCVPAIVLAKRLHEKSPGMAAGAFPCVGQVSLENYLAELKPLAIRTY